MIIMSIDGSTKSTGIAIFDNKQLIYYKCISASGTNMLNRISVIVHGIDEIARKYKVEKVFMEDVIPEDVKHNQSVYKALMYLQGAVALMFNKLKIQVIYFTASEWRAKVGIKTGRGVKRDVLKAKSIALVKEAYHIDVNDDIADSICIGLAALTIL